jgi:protein-disulfide isomerase
VSAPQSPVRRVLGPAVAVLVVVALALAAVASGGGSGDGASGDARATAPSGVQTPDGGGDAGGNGGGNGQDETPRLPYERRAADDPLALGDPDAPVVLAEWGDFQCTFCGRHARETEPALVTRFVDAGVLRLEWHDFPYLGKDSVRAARAARAAGRQGEFWAYHDALYAEERGVGDGSLSRENLVATAEEVGLDVGRFREDLDDPRVAAAVDEDFAAGQQLGVSGTPTFLVNGRPVVGAQPTETFASLVRQERAAAGGSTPSP